jgi:hypothetical protein
VPPEICLAPAKTLAITKNPSEMRAGFVPFCAYEKMSRSP